MPLLTSLRQLWHSSACIHRSSSPTAAGPLSGPFVFIQCHLHQHLFIQWHVSQCILFYHMLRPANAKKWTHAQQAKGGGKAASWWPPAPPPPAGSAAKGGGKAASSAASPATVPAAKAGGKAASSAAAPATVPASDPASPPPKKMPRTCLDQMLRDRWSKCFDDAPSGSGLKSFAGVNCFG